MKQKHVHACHNQTIPVMNLTGIAANTFNQSPQAGCSRIRHQNFPGVYTCDYTLMYGDGQTLKMFSITFQVGISCRCCYVSRLLSACWNSGNRSHG